MYGQTRQSFATDGALLGNGARDNSGGDVGVVGVDRQ